MNKLFCFFLLSFVSFSLNAQKGIVTIKGYAPAYVGKKIEIVEIQDYLSMTEALVATTTVDADSTFTVYFETNKTQIKQTRTDKHKS